MQPPLILERQTAFSFYLISFSSTRIFLEEDPLGDHHH